MIFGNKFVWWTGVVEDRNDPESMGRCKVRIFGYHTDDITILPTADLPWAIPLQSITSAATSGLGQTPVGIVPGTWVVGWFLDGEEAQRPLMIGTIAGKPEKVAEATKKETQQTKKSATNIVRSRDGSPVVDQDNKPITTIGKVDRTDDFYPLTSKDMKSIFATIAEKASGNDLSKESMDGRLGKYQLSVTTLVALGYVKRPSSDFGLTAWTDTKSNWTGKDGIFSKEQFLSSESAQYNAVLTASESNYKSLLTLGKITQDDDPKIIGALLGTSLIMGPTNSDKLNKKTESGVRAKDFFVAVNSALGGSTDDFNINIEDAINYLADTNNSNNSGGVLNNKELLKRKGFSDPNKQFPRYEYAGLSDVNKLALGDMSHKVFTVKQNKRVESIPLAKTTQTWDEPLPSYGANYPYNQVIETEAGHVIELDSTPNAERIHVFHKAGTYIEIDVNGSMVRKVVGDNYEILDRNNFTYVKGSQMLTVEGKTSILVRDSAKIVVEGDLSVTSHKDTSIETSGTATIVGKNINVSSHESLNIVSDGSLNLQGKNINLYAKGGSISQKAGQDFSMESGAASTFSIKGGQSLLMDAAIIKSKMGANSIREVAFSALPLPEAKTPDSTPVPVLERSVVPQSTFVFDSMDEGHLDYIALKEENGEINNNISVPVFEAAIPANILTSAKTTIPYGSSATAATTKTTSNTLTTVKTINSTTSNVVTTTTSVKNTTTNTTVTTTTTTNLNQTNKAANTTIKTTPKAASSNVNISANSTVLGTITGSTKAIFEDAANAVSTTTTKTIKKVTSFFLPESKW
jgi:hypothetical protein